MRATLNRFRSKRNLRRHRGNHLPYPQGRVLRRIRRFIRTLRGWCKARDC